MIKREESVEHMQRLKMKLESGKPLNPGYSFKMAVMGLAWLMEFLPSVAWNCHPTRITQKCRSACLNLTILRRILSPLFPPENISPAPPFAFAELIAV